MDTQDGQPHAGQPFDAQDETLYFKRRPPFGARVRALREARYIPLRRFAQQVNMTPTYLSKIERGEMPPPSEDKILAIARALNQDPDELLALADRIASDLPALINRHPREIANFLRVSNGLSAAEFAALQLRVERIRNRKESSR